MVVKFIWDGEAETELNIVKYKKITVSKKYASIIKSQQREIVRYVYGLGTGQYAHCNKQ